MTTKRFKAHGRWWPTTPVGGLAADLYGWFQEHHVMHVFREDAIALAEAVLSGAIVIPTAAPDQETSS